MTEIKQVEIDALDAILTLHADHEQNASTTTVRNVGSTEAHPYVAIASGISALWGICTWWCKMKKSNGSIKINW